MIPQQVIWYPRSLRDLREPLLSQLIGLAREDIIRLWADEIDGCVAYVITPAITNPADLTPRQRRALEGFRRWFNTANFPA